MGLSCFTAVLAEKLRTAAAQAGQLREVHVVCSQNETFEEFIREKMRDLNGSSPPDAFDRIDNRFEVTVQRCIAANQRRRGLARQRDPGVRHHGGCRYTSAPSCGAAQFNQPPMPVVGEYRFLKELEPHTLFACAPAARRIPETMAL
jgi:hypothetical protein